MHLECTDHLLTTTRSVRKRLDLERPVDPAIIERCIEIAIQAPTGSNAQGWHFVVITEPHLRREIGNLYRRAFEDYLRARASEPPRYPPQDPRAQQLPRVVSSAQWLAEHMGEVPAMILPCIEGRAENAGALAQASLYGSILPAVWSLMLALRARGLGSAWTTLHIAYEQRVAELLGIPADFTQAALLPVAWFRGRDFRPAKRLPVHAVTSWNHWGSQRNSD